VKYTDEEGTTRRKYQQIVYPAHREALCNGVTHRQWNGRGGGCLLDEVRLPWRELQAERQSNPRKYRLVFQQEDVDPAGALIDEAWVEGGTDREGFEAPGCLDLDRRFLEWPKGMRGLIDYVTVDPSAGNFWAIEWWSANFETGVRYLIQGLRSMAFKAGDLLQYETGDGGQEGRLTGVMVDWQSKSYELGHPIRVWVIEGNGAFKHLIGYDHYKLWQQTFRDVGVILHKTGLNKNDQQSGVEALMPALYREGRKRLPYHPEDREARRFVDAFRRELITYPDGATSDMVMADWMAEWNMKQIQSRTRRQVGEEAKVIDARLPKYLRRQMREVSLSR
jgi:hypothetical protein